MRRWVALLAAVMLVLGALVAYAGSEPGPAPDAGDGIPDGSGFVTPPGPIGDGEPLGLAPGPAPNSGDGIPDGSGMDAPYGPI